MPSDAGRQLARTLATDLGAAGVCVISGLALGIDSAAHEGSLAAGAPTIAVLGGGHDHLFPARNRELAARIVAGGGAVVSPYEPHIPARPHQFLARNGIVAALADAVVVVEAAARSGALNTASWAADKPIPVMAFPGDIDRPKVAGCLALIRDGALLVRGAADVLDQLGIRGARSSQLPLTGIERAGANPAATANHAPQVGGALAARVIERLARQPLRIDALLAAEASPQALLACIGELVTAGVIIESDDATLRLPRA